MKSNRDAQESSKDFGETKRFRPSGQESLDEGGMRLRSEAEAEAEGFSPARAQEGNGAAAGKGAGRRRDGGSTKPAETAGPKEKAVSAAAAKASRSEKDRSNPSGSSGSGRRPKKRRRGLKALLGILVVILVLVLMVGLFVSHKLNMIRYAGEHGDETYVTADFSKGEDNVIRLPDDTVDPNQPSLNEAEEMDPSALASINEEIAEQNKKPVDLLYDPQILNVMLMGVDSRDRNNFSRSDSMILLSVDYRHHKIHMNSIMRDLYVEIPGQGFSRLNAANAIGGPELLMKTVEHNFKVRVDRYALVNLYNMEKIIDAVGGISLEVSDAEFPELNRILRSYNYETGAPVDTALLSHAGYQHLNGKQATAYARIRHVGNSDYQRTERQREVLELLIEKAKHCNIFELNSLADAILPNVMTNFSRSEVASLMTSAPGLLQYDVVSARIPVNGSFSETYVRRMAVLLPNLDKNIQFLATSVYGK